MVFCYRLFWLFHDRDGRLFTSVQDLSRYLASFMVQEDDIVETDDTVVLLLNETSKQTMLSPQPIHQQVSFAERLFYGSVQQEIFWVQTNDVTHGHDGGDFGSFTLMYYEPVHGVGIVILTNYASLNGSIALMQLVKKVTEQSERVVELLREIRE